MNLNLNHLSTTFKLHLVNVYLIGTGVLGSIAVFPENATPPSSQPRNNPKVARQSTKTPRHHQSGRRPDVFSQRWQIKRWAPFPPTSPTQTPVDVLDCVGEPFMKQHRKNLQIGSSFFVSKRKTHANLKVVETSASYVRLPEPSLLPYPTPYSGRRAWKKRIGQASSLIHRRQSWTSSCPGVSDVNPWVSKNTFKTLGFFFTTKTLQTRFCNKTFAPQKHLRLKLFGAFLNRIQTALYLHPDESCDATHRSGFRYDFPIPISRSGWLKSNFGQGFSWKIMEDLGIQNQVGLDVIWNKGIRSCYQGVIPPEHTGWMIISTKTRATLATSTVPIRSFCHLFLWLILDSFGATVQQTLLYLLRYRFFLQRLWRIRTKLFTTPIDRVANCCPSFVCVIRRVSASSDNSDLSRPRKWWKIHPSTRWFVIGLIGPKH